MYCYVLCTYYARVHYERHTCSQSTEIHRLYFYGQKKLVLLLACLKGLYLNFTFSHKLYWGHGTVILIPSPWSQQSLCSNFVKLANIPFNIRFTHVVTLTSSTLIVIIMYITICDMFSSSSNSAEIVPRICQRE